MFQYMGNSLFIAVPVIITGSLRVLLPSGQRSLLLF
jgi:hypothetical protein